MPHATHKARRIQTSDVPHAPVRRRGTDFGRQLLLASAVGLTTLVIVSLYAASFSSRAEMRVDDVDYPRWTVLSEDFIDQITPVKDHLSGVKATLSNLANGGRTQAAAALILKEKIEARAAASGTPETSEPPATPETP